MKPCLKIMQHVLITCVNRVYHIVSFVICIMVNKNIVKPEKMIRSVSI